MRVDRQLAERYFDQDVAPGLLASTPAAAVEVLRRAYVQAAEANPQACRQLRESVTDEDLWPSQQITLWLLDKATPQELDLIEQVPDAVVWAGLASAADAAAADPFTGAEREPMSKLSEDLMGWYMQGRRSGYTHAESCVEETVTRMIAQRYADRPGYRQDWRPVRVNPWSAD